MIRKVGFLLAVGIAALLAGAAGDNLDYWLDQAQPAASQPTDSQPAASQPAPPESDETPALGEGVPGAVELSDGRVLAGYIHTTRDQPWAVYVEADKRWRLLPSPAVLSITAAVDEERMEPEWRWAGVGRPERVYTGRQYPFRRFRWTFRLIDGSEAVGVVKGQPFWVVADGRRTGPYILHERDKGPAGTTLAERVYVKRVVISRRAMLQAASRPAAQKPLPSSR